MEKVAIESSAFVYTPPTVDPRGTVQICGTIFGNTGMQFQGKWRYFPHHAFVVILNGRGQYRDETGFVAQVEPGCAIKVYPTIGHSYRPDKDTTWDELYIVFSGEIFTIWMNSPQVQAMPPVVTCTDRGRDCWNLLSDLKAASTPFAAAATRIAFLENAVDWESEKAAVSTWPAGELARQMLVLELSQDLDMKSVASRLSLTYDAFRHRFAEAYGISPYAFRLRARLKLAEEMLKMTDLSIDSIAGRTGFADGFHLSKAFKQRNGVSPSAFRRSASVS